FCFGDQDQNREGLKAIVDDLGDIDAREVNTVAISEGVNLRVGRYGPYLEVAAETEGGDPKRVSVPDDLAPDELTAAKAAELIETQGGEDRELGVDPETGHTIVAKNGRFGPYVSEVLPEPAEKPKRGAKKPKPRTASLFKSMDLDSIDLETALKLLSLPRVVGQDEEGTDITAQNGRYGPYLKKGTDSRSLTDEEQIFTITVEEALKIYAEPKQRGGRRAAAPLKELGEDPETKKPVVVKDGRFGPYVTDGETNATLRKDDSVEAVTLERAATLLAEKRAKGPAKKKTTRKSPAKKATAKKTTASKTTAAKKSTAKSTSSKTASSKSAESNATATKKTTTKPKTPGVEKTDQPSTRQGEGTTNRQAPAEVTGRVSEQSGVRELGQGPPVEAEGLPFVQQ